MGFELQRRYDPQTVSVVVECSGTTALVLSELDINKQYIEHWSLGENTTNASRSRETTPSVSHVEQRRIFVLGKPRSRKDGLRFGNGDKVDFQLPKKGREYVTISGLQFRIHVNKYHSWMLIDESRNGTIVNNEALSSKRKQGCINRTDGLLQMQVALHPENPNRIQVGNLLFLVHIIGDTDNGYWSLSDDLSELADLGNLDLQTQTTLSTVKGPSLMLGSTQQARNDNHVLDSQVLSSSKQMRVKKVILKRTGEHAVGKIYATTTQEQLARAQFNYLFPVLKDDDYFVSLIKLDYTDSLFTVITKYRQASTLEVLIDSDAIPDSSDLLLAYAQVGGGALGWLEQNGIIHRNIRPAVILIDDYGPMSSRLTGFSESCNALTAGGVVGHENYRAPEVRKGSKYDMSVDVYSLSATIEECLSLNKLNLSTQNSGIENLIGRGLTTQPRDRPTPSEIYTKFDDFIGGHLQPWPPFHNFSAHREFVFSCVREGSEDFIRTSEFLEALRALASNSPEFDFQESSRNKGELRLLDQKQVQGYPHSLLRSAAKLCHHLNLVDLESALMDEPESTEKQFTLSYVLSFQVSYHLPSSMVNLSQVLNIVGTAGSRACEGIEQPLRVQEVYGVFNWDGVYIDYESFEKVSLFLQNRKNLRFDMQPITELRKVDNPVLQRRFTDVESSRYIILITPLLNPNMVLLRRSDCAVNMDQVRGDPGAWDESVSATHTSFEPAEDATKECDSMGLHDLGKTIRRLAEQSRDLDWKKVATVELNRDWDGDSVTSIDTSPSFLANEAAEIAGRDDLRFRFRRRSIPSQSVHSGATTTNQEVQHSRPRHRPSRNSHTKNKALADFTADEPADRKRLRIEASKVEMDRPAKRAETQAPDIVSWLDGVQSPGKPRASK